MVFNFCLLHNFLIIVTILTFTFQYQVCIGTSWTLFHYHQSQMREILNNLTREAWQLNGTLSQSIMHWRHFLVWMNLGWPIWNRQRFEKNLVKWIKNESSKLDLKLHGMRVGSLGINWLYHESMMSNFIILFIYAHYTTIMKCFKTKSYSGNTRP